MRLLGRGELKAKLNIEVHGASKSAIAAVEKAGGSVTIPELVSAADKLHNVRSITSDYREIGEVLKLSESATKSLLFRAYETLRETLRQFI